VDDNIKFYKHAKNIYNKKGKLLSFQNQLNLYREGKLFASDKLIVSKYPIIPFKKIIIQNPIIIVQSVIKKAREKHNIPWDIIYKLPKIIQKSPLALESKGNTLLIFTTNYRNQNGEILNLMIVILIGKRTHELKVNEIRTIYFDSVEKEIRNTIKNNQKIYTNKHTKKWLSSIELH
jgi:hypothetical protein